MLIVGFHFITPNLRL